jgi:drug/metabolite transporter (DMT)-like permease
VRWADAPGTVTAAYRMAISTLVLTPFVLRQGFVKPKKSDPWLGLVLLAGLFIAFDHGTMNTAIGLTRIANCTLLNNIAPLWVALFALFVWREKLKKWFWAGLMLTLTGAAVILGSDFLRHPQLGLGDGFAFVSSFFYGGYFLITQSSRAKISALQYIWMVNLVSALLLTAFNLALGVPMLGYDPRTWLVFAGAGIISQTIGYFSVAYSLGHLPASIVSPTMVIQIAVTSLIAIPLAGESLSWIQVAGGITVLMGIMTINLTRVQTSPRYLNSVE